MYTLLLGTAMMAQESFAYEPQCGFNIAATGVYYGRYTFYHEDSCDATFEVFTLDDTAHPGFNCQQLYGLQTAVLYSSTGKMAGMLSCANQDFDFDYTKTEIETPLVAGVEHSKVELTSEYKVSLTFVLKGTVGGWSNLLHINAKGENKGWGNRLPAVWFHNNSRRLHICTACDGHTPCLNPATDVPLNVVSKLTIQVQGGKFRAHLGSSLIGELACNNPYTPSPGEEAIVYLSDPWYPASKVVNVHFQYVRMPSCTVEPVNTVKLLDAMGTAQRDYALCHDDISEITSTLTVLTRSSYVINKVIEATDSIMDKIDAVMDRVIKMPPQGLGIADTLGKIPKIGIFIKMGMKAASKVVDGFEPLADLIAKWYKRVDDAINFVGKTFTAAKVTSTGTSAYLYGSYKILEAAHNCSKNLGYECGRTGAGLEEVNTREYPRMKPQLEEIARVGRACHDVLSPMDALLREMAKIAEKIAMLLQPVVQLLEDVKMFISDLEKEIQKFLDALNDEVAVQCVLEIFEPVTDTVNLLTCPVDEAVGALFHFVIDTMTNQLASVLTTAANEGITSAVDALIPDDLDISVPNPLEVLEVPVDFWMAVCDEAAVVFPGLAQTVQALTTTGPLRISGKDLEDSVLSKALLDTPLTVNIGGYNSACVEAYNEMGTDFENCQKVWEAVEAAAELAACETAKAAYVANQASVDAAQAVFNEANNHFLSAQKEFNAAQNHLNKVQSDLDGAKQSVENEKKKCPSCRCGGCSGFDPGCWATSAWCCPARHTCLAALEVAKGGVDVAKGTVTIAEGSVSAAAYTYLQASNAMQKALKDLQYYENLAAQSEKDVKSACNRRRLEILQPPRTPLAKRLTQAETEDVAVVA